MSFSADVKNELLKVESRARHCRLAELSAYIRFLEKYKTETETSLMFRIENREVMEKYFTLLKKAFNIDVVMNPEESADSKRNSQYFLIKKDQHVLDTLHAAMEYGVLNLDCCRRAFLRASFLASGSISAPEKYYHLEIVCAEKSTAEVLQKVMQSFSLDAKIVSRKKDYIVYLKEGEQIVTMLGEMGASISFLNLESIRVMREMRGNVNRRVNCETANLNKTIVSSVRQVEEIKLIQEHMGLGALKKPLKEMAEIRLQYPDAPLALLGQYLDPPIGKSGVNHRLKKLSEIAETFRDI